MATTDFDDIIDGIDQGPARRGAPLAGPLTGDGLVDALNYLPSHVRERPLLVAASDGRAFQVVHLTPEGVLMVEETPF